MCRDDSNQIGKSDIEGFWELMEYSPQDSLLFYSSHVYFSDNNTCNLPSSTKDRKYDNNTSLWKVEIVNDTVCFIHIQSEDPTFSGAWTILFLGDIQIDEKGKWVERLELLKDSTFVAMERPQIDPDIDVEELRRISAP